MKMKKEIEEKLLKAPFHYAEDNWNDFVKKDKTSLSAPVIHVAGSNGKSSVIAFLEGILIEAGYKVGAFSDVHSSCPFQGIRLNGENIKEEDFCGIFERKSKLFSKFDLSFQEMMTSVAFDYFEKKKPDIVLLESSLGGDFDPTNFPGLDTVLAILTSCGLVHTQYLGTTSSEIALNDAGILKNETPLLVGSADENSKTALLDFVKRMGSKFYQPDSYHFAHLLDGKYHFDYGGYSDLVLNSRAVSLLADASLALEAIALIKSSFPVKEKAIREGLLRFDLAARFEAYGNLIFEGASNPEAIRTLIPSLNALSFGKPIHVLYASRLGSNIAMNLPILGNAVASINLTTCPDENARAKEDYFLYEEDYPFVEDALAGAKALQAKYPEDCVAFVGDLDFALWARSRLL